MVSSLFVPTTDLPWELDGAVDLSDVRFLRNYRAIAKIEDGPAKAERGLGKRGAKLIHQRTGVFVAVGSGVCHNCRILLSKLDCEAESTTESGKTPAEELTDETEVLVPMENLTLVNREAGLGEMDMGMSWAKEQKEHLKKCKRYLKTDYKVHVSASLDVAVHCRVYALKDPKDRDYQSQCSHEHNTSCDNCDDLTKTMDEIEAAIEKLASSDVKEELCFVMRKARKDIVNWKAHLLRSGNQEEARLSQLDALDSRSIVLVQDWAMKFLPRKFRESQTDWYAKTWYFLAHNCSHQERRRPEPPDDDVRKCIHELQPGWLYNTLRHVRCAKTGQRSSASS
ncbi:hypothetical protein ACROYT_G042455 [Oculina patagonica]